MSGAVLVGTSALRGGVRGLDRWTAIAMTVVPAGFLLIGTAGPIVRAAELTQLTVPLQVALGSTSPLLLIGSVIVTVWLKDRRTRQ